MKKQTSETKQAQQNSYTEKDWDKAPVSLEKIANLLFDWNIYPRKEIDKRKVNDYAKAMKTGSVFPPIRVALFEENKVVIDGFHRAHSRIQLKIDYIECKILPFQSEAELFAEAVRANSSHGKPFTDIEVKANIRRLQRYKFNVKDIVSIVHVPASGITSESTKPILVLTTPSGRKLSCAKVRPGKEGVHGLTCLKNALTIVANWAEDEKIPNDPVFRELVERVQTALKNPHFWEKSC
jgi:hypothetical protein